MNYVIGQNKLYANPESFLDPNPLNNQSDFLKFLWRHFFVKNKLEALFKDGRQNPGLVYYWYISNVLMVPDDFNK